MKRRTTKILRSVTAAAICLTVAVSGRLFDGGSVLPQPVRSYADTQSDLQQKIADADAKIKEIEAKIAAAGTDIESNKELQDNYWEKLVATQNKIDLVNLSVATKEEEIEAKEAEIANVELRIQDTEFRIRDKEAEIDMLDRKNKDNIYRFGQIIHAMYITDSDDYLSIIAGSADFYDIFVRSEIMKSVKEQNLNFMNMLLADIEKLRDDEVQLEKDKKQLQSDKITLEEEKDELLSQKQALDEEKKYYNDLNSGYWDEYACAKTDSPDVKATAFIRGDKALVAVGNFSSEPRTINLKIDGRWLGARKIKLVARPIPGFQKAHAFALGDPIPVPPKQGWMFELLGDGK